MFHARSPRRIALLVALAVGTLGLIGLIAAEGLRPRPALAEGLLFVIASGLLLYTLTVSLTRRVMQAHSLLTAVVEGMGDGLIILGRDRRIVYANPAAVRMLECRSAANLRGISADEFARRYRVTYMNGELVTPDAFTAQRALSSSSAVRYRARLMPSPGHELVVLSSASSVRANPDEAATMVVSVLHDITEAETLERDRDQLFASAAHALETPLAIIRASAEATAVRHQCERIELLVQNLRVIARGRLRTLELQVRELELGPLVEVALRAMSDVAVRAELHGTVKVRGDEERLALAIANVVHEATCDGDGTPITLRLATNAWTAEVAAHGKVLAHGDHADSKLSRSATETILDAHGGTMGIEEHDGERIAWIRLPLVGADHDE